MLTLFFDTETTGLTRHPLTQDRFKPEIIEFYGALWDLETDSLEEEFETLICPTKISEVPEKITRITGIDQAMLWGKPHFEDVALKIGELIGQADRIAGHNVTFDADMIDLEFARLDMLPPDWPDKREWLCTVEQTVHLRGHRLSLGDLHELLFGEAHKSSHRARGDTEAHVRVVKELIKREML